MGAQVIWRPLLGQACVNAAQNSGMGCCSAAQPHRIPSVPPHTNNGTPLPRAPSTPLTQPPSPTADTDSVPIEIETQGFDGLWFHVGATDIVEQIDGYNIRSSCGTMTPLT